MAIFNDHRFAFFYWALWRKDNNQEPPDLVTLDWHQDLASPDTKDELKALDLNNTFEVSVLAWARLNPNNDDHIKSAMYCNLIGNAFVVCKQFMKHGSEDETFEDMFGNQHIIRKFNTTEETYDYLKDTTVKKVYFDIDLDYFTIENISTNSDQKTTYVRDEEIRKIINPDSDLMRWIFQRIKGFTIALEPEFVGGFTKALRLYGIIERTLFSGSVFKWKTTWKHLG
jgi:hypothetical protein